MPTAECDLIFPTGCPFACGSIDLGSSVPVRPIRNIRSEDVHPGATGSSGRPAHHMASIRIALGRPKIGYPPADLLHRLAHTQAKAQQQHVNEHDDMTVHRRRCAGNAGLRGIGCQPAIAQRQA